MTAPSGVAKKRRRFRFSLNGLAIQLSAFALSFTLVALLVVSGSQAAFVEQNETLAGYVPIGTPAPTEGAARRPAAVPATPEVSPAVGTPAVETTAPEPDKPDAAIELTDSDAGTAMFGGETLVPGATVERCITVTYTGTVEATSIRLYAASAIGDLAPYLDLAIDLGDDAAGSFGGCTGFSPARTLFVGTLADFADEHSNYATGRKAWDPADEQETRSFRFRVAVQDVPAAAGKSVTFGFSWRTEAA